MKLQIFSCAKSGAFLLNSNVFLIETHYKANAFANVFNGKGGFNGKFFAMLCGIQAGRFCVCLWKLQIYSCAKSGVVLLNSNDFLIETLSKGICVEV